MGKCLNEGSIHCTNRGKYTTKMKTKNDARTLIFNTLDRADGRIRLEPKLRENKQSTEDKGEQVKGFILGRIDLGEFQIDLADGAVSLDGSSDRSPGIIRYELQRFGQGTVASLEDDGTHLILGPWGYLYPAIIL